MSAITPLLSLFAIGLAAAMIPGPTFFVVGQTAMERSRKEALQAVAGAATSAVLWATAALVGTATLFALYPSLERTLQLAGGLYLIYLGVQFWRSARTQPKATSAPAALRGNAYLRGFMTDLLNPKTLVFFGSIFVLVIKADSPLWVRVAAIGVTATVSLTWYGAVALFLSSGSVRTRFLSMRNVIERVCGAVMFAFGVNLLLGLRATFAK
jgi:threonine efflux protein